MSQRAFTLIELLIVVAIIGILASSVVVNLSLARTRARDARRKADLKSVQTALEVYAEEKGNYPSTLGLATCFAGATGPPLCSEPGSYIPNLAPDYVGSLPLDPLVGKPSAFAIAHQATCTSGPAGYRYASDGRDYKLIGYCTVESAIDSFSPFYDAIRPTWALGLATGGARSW
ncbi:MAG: prepilin-type N-terminal cleavage/methylation domain-containing protein [Patescibacteria group bacterium]